MHTTVRDFDHGLKAGNATGPAAETAPDDPLQITGRLKPAGSCKPFPAFRVACSNLGVIITACTVTELYPVTQAAQVKISGRETYVGFASLASTPEKAIKKAAAWLEKMSCTESSNA